MGDNESNGRHWETMEDKGRQELAKADTPSNTGTHMRGDNGETRPREGEHTFQHRHTCATMGDKGRQDFGKADTASNTGTHMRGDNGETRGDKTSGRTQAHMWGDEGRQWGDKTSGRRTHLPTQAHMHVPQWGAMGDKGRQDFRKADAPSNRGTHMLGDIGRPGETRPWEGGRSIQHRHTCGETMGDKRRQDLGKADAASNTGTHAGRQWETKGNKGRQDLGKADTPSNTGTHTIQHRHTCGETMGDKGRQDLGKADALSNTGGWGGVGCVGVGRGGWVNDRCVI